MLSEMQFKTDRRCFYVIQQLNQTMKEEERKIEIDISEFEVKQEKTFTKTIEIKGYSLAHENILQMDELQERTKDLRVKNNLASILGDKLFKTTEIQFQNKVIRIVENFTFNPLPQEKMEMQSVEVEKQPEQTHSKKLLGRRTFIPSVYEDEEEKKGRDTKNVVKNIYRLFQNWVEEHLNPDLEVGSALEQLLRKNGKYNNSLIISLSKISKLREAFISFSSTVGEEYIGKSKIQDKKSHLDALKRYESICWKQGSLAKIPSGGESKTQDKNSSKDGNNDLVNEKQCLVKQSLIQLNN